MPKESAVAVCMARMGAGHSVVVWAGAVMLGCPWRAAEEPSQEQLVGLCLVSRPVTGVAEGRLGTRPLRGLGRGGCCSGCWVIIGVGGSGLNLLLAGLLSFLARLLSFLFEFFRS